MNCNSGLLGEIEIAENVPTMDQLEKEYSHISQGGEMSPGNCVSKVNVAIIIPYRNRMGQLRVFLNHMHKFLSRQQLYYHIYIINQVISYYIHFQFAANIPMKVHQIVSK